MRTALAIARNDFVILLTEPGVYAVLLAMPVILVFFLGPLIGLSLHRVYPDVSSSGLAVAGLMVMFAFFVTTIVGYSMLEERLWNTWPRLRITSLPELALVAAKGVVPFVTAFWQQAILLGVGVLFFGLPLAGAGLAVVVITVPLAACVVGMGMAVAAFTTSARQVSVLGNVGSLVFGGLGGALTPVGLMPGWAQSVAPVTPGYWAVEGLHRLLFGSVSVRAVLPDSGALLGYAAVFLILAAYRMSSADEKGTV